MKPNLDEILDDGFIEAGDFGHLVLYKKDKQRVLYDFTNDRIISKYEIDIEEDAKEH